MKQIIENIDELIRSGEGGAAKQLLRGVLGKRLERNLRLDVARLARRLGHPMHAVRLLHSLVRPTGKENPTATPAERAEYAAALTYLGAQEEAVAILAELPPSETPEALLFTAFALFAQWDYEGSLPVLRKYVQLPLGEYPALVARVNLAAALVYERHWEEATPLLNQLIADTQAPGLQLLSGNVLELQAQAAIARKDWKAATHSLNEAKARLKASKGYSRFFVEKWEGLQAFLQDPTSRTGHLALAQVREGAQNLRHGETLRDCDRFEALAKQDAVLLAKVYFGTPYEPFRRRLLSDAGSDFKIPNKFHWEFVGPGQEYPTLELSTGEIVGTAARLKSGQLLHRLLLALCADFYRPARVAVAHHVLYPDEFFNPVSSPPKVYEAVRRLRDWLSAHHFPIKIEESDGYYRLSSRASCGITIRREVGTVSPRFLLLDRFKSSREGFDAKAVGKHFAFSTKTAVRLLNKAAEAGVIRREGKGRATRYFPK